MRLLQITVLLVFLSVSMPGAALDNLYSPGLPCDGFFSSASCWRNLHVPGAGDNAFFIPSGSFYFVNFIQPATTRSADINSALGFNLGAQNYVLTEQLTVGAFAGANSVLFTNGGEITTANVHVGREGTGRLDLYATRLRASANIEVGLAGGTGTFNVFANSHASAEDFIAGSSGGDATVTVSGTGALLEIAGGLSLRDGAATLTVTDAGRVTVGDGVSATQDQSIIVQGGTLVLTESQLSSDALRFDYGTVVVEGSIGGFVPNFTGDVVVRGTEPAESANFTLRDGALVRNVSSVQIGLGGTGEMHILSGAGLLNGSFEGLEVGIVKVDAVIGGVEGSGKVVVDGTNSSWGWIKTLTVGAPLGVGELTVSGGARVASDAVVIGEQNFFVPGKGSVRIIGPGSELDSASDFAIGRDAFGGAGASALEVNDGGTAKAGATMRVIAPGTLAVSGGKLMANQLVNEGSIVFDNSSSPRAIVDAVVMNDGGSIDIRSSAPGEGTKVSFKNDFFESTGSLTVATGSEAVFEGKLVLSDPFLMTDGLVTLAGSFSPNDQFGILVVSGDLRLAASHTLTMDVGGPRIGTLYEHIEVRGELALGGRLDIELTDRGAGLFQPSAGDTFALLAAEVISGAFLSHNLDALAASNPGLVFSLVLNEDQFGSFDALSLVVTAVPLPASELLLVPSLAMLRVGRRRQK